MTNTNFNIYEFNKSIYLYNFSQIVLKINNINFMLDKPFNLDSS